MKNMYQGIFVKEFLLFYGETLTFYFSVQEDGKSRDTEKLQLSLADMDTAGITRYKLLNQILAARKLLNRGSDGAGGGEISVAGRLHGRPFHPEEVGVTEDGNKEFDRGH